MPTINYRNYRQVEKKYEKLANDDMQWYFDSFLELVPKPSRPKFNWDIVIAYLFMRVEQAQRMTLYAAMVKEYKVDAVLAAKAIDNLHMTRPKFLAIYKALAGAHLNNTTYKKGKKAEAVRDKIMHGKSLIHGRGISLGEKVSEQEKRNAVIWVLEYAKLFNKQTKRRFKFEPFGRMQGFNGRGKPHDEVTSEWMLKGMGCPLPSENENNEDTEVPPNN